MRDVSHRAAAVLQMDRTGEARRVWQGCVDRAMVSAGSPYCQRRHQLTSGLENGTMCEAVQLVKTMSVTKQDPSLAMRYSRK